MIFGKVLLEHHDGVLQDYCYCLAKLLTDCYITFNE